MPFLKSPDLQPVRGTDFSIPSTYLPPGFHFPQNLQYIRGELQKRPGKTVLGDVSLGAQKILHLGIFEQTDQSVKLVRHTKTNTQVFQPGPGTWQDFTGLDMTGSETDFFDNTVVTESDLYIFVNNAIDAPRSMLNAANAIALGGSPPKATCCEYMTPYLMLANLIEGGNNRPYKLAWSDTGAPTVWTGGNSGSVLLSDEPSAIRRVKKLKSYAMVYKEKSLYRGYQVGSPDIFDFISLGMGKGLYAPRAIADDGNIHYYMGLWDFYKNDGLRAESFGKSVREYIFNRLNRSLNSTCHAIHVEQYKEIWFFITTTGLSWPTEVWKYNYDMDFWYFDTVQNAISSAMFKQTSFVTWDQDTGTWDSAVGSWDSQAGVTGAQTPVFGFDTGFVQKMDGNVYDDNLVAVDSHLDTKDYFGEMAKFNQTYQTQRDIERDSRWLQVDIFAKGDSVKLSYSLDYGTTWVYVGENNLTAQVEKTTFWIDIIAKHIRFRLQQNSSMKNLLVRSLQPYFLDAGEILQNT